MDAKVLSAAVAAAIRVTVSTTLISCGGHSTTDGTKLGGGGTPSVQAGQAGSSDSQLPPRVDVTPSGGAAIASAGMPMTSGGMALASGGMGAAAGVGEVGEAGSAGAPALGCPGEIQACLPPLEAVDRLKPLEGAAAACCQTVIHGLFDNLPETKAECVEAQARFKAAPGNLECCNQNDWILSLDKRNASGCTPWGPPVPPEVPLAQLLALRAVV